MSKLHCPCGHTISDVTFPTPHAAHLIQDNDLDANTDYSSTDYRRRITKSDMPERTLYECVECGRLLIEDLPRSNNYISFVPENERLKMVCRD